jgi:hypothetical protein
LQAARERASTVAPKSVGSARIDMSQPLQMGES